VVGTDRTGGVSLVLREGITGIRHS
jgi:hypothetical protein